MHTSFVAMNVEQQLLERYRQARAKPKAFIMFADLDGTFTPMDLSGVGGCTDVVDARSSSAFSTHAWFFCSIIKHDDTSIATART